jgi:hypothetical protein
MIFKFWFKFWVGLSEAIPLLNPSPSSSFSSWLQDHDSFDTIYLFSAKINQ